MTSERDARISGYIDGELNENEKREFEVELARSPDLARELESLRRMTSITESLTFAAFPDPVWDRYWEDTYRQLERRVGWVLVSIGAIVLLAAWLIRFVPDYAVWLLSDAHPWYVRLGSLLLSIGLSTLIVSLVRERIFKGRRDPYRKVIR